MYKTENESIFYQKMLEFDWSKLQSLDYDEVTEAHAELRSLRTAAEALPECMIVFESFMEVMAR